MAYEVTPFTPRTAEYFARLREYRRAYNRDRKQGIRRERAQQLPWIARALTEPVRIRLGHCSRCGLVGSSPCEFCRVETL